MKTDHAQHPSKYSAPNVSVSVLMPARNASQTIRIAVLTTLHALPADAELLVIDDGSDDDTFKVLRSLSDNRLRVFQSESSMGVARSLNFLLNIARGELIARMDADDVCLWWRFRFQLRQLKQQNVDFVFSSPAFIFGSSKAAHLVPIYIPQHRLTSTELASLIPVTNPFAHPTMLARRKVLSALGGYRLRDVEDYDLWRRANIRKFTFHRSALPVTLLRQHPGQVTRQLKWKSHLEASLSRPSTRELEAVNSLLLAKKGSPLFRFEFRHLY